MKFIYKQAVLRFLIVLIVGLPLSSVQGSILTQLRADFRFQALPGADNLSNVVINDIVQDDMGFIWIATSDGLNRYDGQDNIVYRPSDSRRNSLSHSNITSLLIDHQGVLWVGTEDGLNKYHSEQDSFERVAIFRNKQNRGFGSSIQNIFEDSGRRVWIATDDGGVSFISENRKEYHKVTFEKSTDSATFYARDFVETERGDMLIASNFGVLQFNENDNRLTRLVNFNNKSESYCDNVMRFLKLKNGELLIGTTSGVFALSSSAQFCRPLMSSELSKKSITDLHQISETDVLVGTRQSGLYQLNLVDESLKHFEHSSQKYSLLDNQIISIFQSRDQLVWVGTNLGVNLVALNQQSFNHIKFTTQHSHCLTGNTIYAILPDSQNLLWVASFGKGLSRINLESNQCQRLGNIDELPHGILNNVVALFEDELGNVWIGTYDQGVVRYLRDENKFELLSDSLFSKEMLSGRYVTNITGDLKGSVWIATQTGGFFEYSNVSQSLLNFAPSLAELPNQNMTSVNDIVFDNQGFLWLATATEGLWKFEQSSQSFSRVELANSETKKISNALISLKRIMKIICGLVLKAMVFFIWTCSPKPFEVIPLRMVC